MLSNHLIQGWFPLGLTCLISLKSKGLSSVFSSTTIWKHQFFVTQPFFGPTITSIHDYWKNHSFDYMDFCQQSDVSVFNVLSRFVTAFLPRSKCLLISWLQPPSAVILEPRKIKSVTVPLFPFYLSWNDGTGCHDLSFWMLSSKPTFSLSSFTFIKRLFSSSSLSAIRVVSSTYLRLLIFLRQSWFQLMLHPAWPFAWCTLYIG